MSVRSTRQGDTTLIQVEVQLVAGNRQQLREAVTSEIDRGVRNFVMTFRTPATWIAPASAPSSPSPRKFVKPTAHFA